MSKLNELIQKLCPNGVKYKTIKEIATDIYRGSGIKRTDISSDGIPCVRYGEIYTTYGIWFDKCVSHTSLERITNPKYFEYGDILLAITGENIEDIAKSTVYVGHEKCLAGGDIVVVKHHQNPKYLSYALSTTDVRKQKRIGKVKSKVVHSSIPAIESLQVPVPPIEVQQKIVRILDSFTELTIGLTKELTARKQQYEYYRDIILTFDDKHVEFYELSDLFNIKNGYTPSKQEKSYWEDGTVPWFRIEDIRENGNVLSKSSRYVSLSAVKGGLFPENSIIVATSATIGMHALITVPSLANQRFTYLILKDKFLRRFNIKFLYYYCFKLDMYCKEHLNQGNFASVDMKKFAKFKFPVPSLDIQNKIVSILDRFDNLCNDPTNGLPAEIEARQKQYEYYRDKLLTFKKLA